MNLWQQVDMIAAEALMHLEDALVITNLCARDKTSDFNVRPNGYRVGQSVNIKTRPEYQARDFEADGNQIVIQQIRESKRNLSIEHLFDTSVEITAREMAMDLESFSEQVIQPAMYTLAEQCDRYVGSKIIEAAGLYPSTTLFESAADLAQARKAATIQQLNPAGRFCLVDLDLEAQLLGSDYFNRQDARSESGVRVFNEADMGRAMGMNFFSSINFPEYSFTSGTFAGAVNFAAGDNGLIGTTTLPVTGATGTAKAGDRLMIAGVRRPLIVAADFSSASGNIQLVDPITEVIPHSAAVTSIGTGAAWDLRGAIFDDQSLAVAMPILDKPSDKPASVMSRDGYSIRVTQGYDMQNKTETMSLDLLIGANCYDPRRVTLLGKAS